MFSKNYPNIDWWINNQGWIALGHDDYSTSWVRVLDPGGNCYEDKNSTSLDVALEKTDIWLSLEIKNRLGEDPPKKYSNQ